MSTTVRIDIPLFLEMVLYIQRHPDDPKYQQIHSATNRKLASMIHHETYTIMKTAPTGEARNQAFREYLDQMGIEPSDEC